MSIKWEKTNAKHPWSSCNVRQAQRNSKAQVNKTANQWPSGRRAILQQLWSCASAAQPLLTRPCCLTYINLGTDVKEKEQVRGKHRRHGKKLWSRKTCSLKDRISLVIQVCLIPRPKVNWDCKSRRQLWWEWTSNDRVQNPYKELRSKTRT